MFIYLSKILPLLVYPLGLACVILLLLLVSDLWRRRWQWRSTLYLVAFLALYLGGNHYVSHWLLYSLERVHPPLPTDATAEVIVVLGGSTHPQLPPRTLPEVREEGDRLLYAAQLYQQGVAPQLLVTGGRLAWLSGTAVDTEARDMVVILGMLGVPEDAIWLEERSQNTYENALFSRDILAEQGIERIILVTSAYHMRRSVAIFEKQGFEVVPAPADFFVTDWGSDAAGGENNIGSRLFYLLPQSEYLDRTTKGLKEYFGLVVYGLQGWL